MKINKDLDAKIQQFPQDLVYLAKILLSEIESGKKSHSQIEEMIRQEIREIVLEEMGE
ncbi:hypothetical protein V7161_14990 [Neobacillus drentensis]|uniref:hypothetical protein n=1 Tax=Neobacillus drentensis TaxID=220684 RepID=UPI0030030EFF